MSFKDRIQKVLDYYDIFKKENLTEKVKPILKTLLIEDDEREIKEIEEAKEIEEYKKDAHPFCITTSLR